VKFNKFKQLKKLAGRAISKNMIKDKVLLAFCKIIEIKNRMIKALIR
jgi:hypothetical protein